MIIRKQAGAIVLLALLLLCASSAQATVTVTLGRLGYGLIEPTTGSWTAGNLIQVNITAQTDANNDLQGFYGAEFGSEGMGFTVDTTKLKIHDVAFVGTQIDAENNATSYDTLLGYSKAADTWVYQDFTSFVGSVVIDPNGSFFRAVPKEPLGGSTALGVRNTAVNFLHLVLEVQPGLSSGQSASVTFTGQVVATNVSQQDTRANLFGTASLTAMGTGSFQVVNLPEPASISLLAALGLMYVRRRRQ
jgi:hypothetical protein